MTQSRSGANWYSLAQPGWPGLTVSPFPVQPPACPAPPKADVFCPPRRRRVTVKTLAPGDGVNFPKKGDTVSMHYVGTLTNGNKFDSSRDRGQPFVTQIGVGRVIKGWDEGVPQLSLGQKAVLECTPGKHSEPPPPPSSAPDR